MRIRIHNNVLEDVLQLSRSLSTAESPAYTYAPDEPSMLQLSRSLSTAESGVHYMPDVGSSLLQLSRSLSTAESAPDGGAARTSFSQLQLSRSLSTAESKSPLQAPFSGFCFN